MTTKIPKTFWTDPLQHLLQLPLLLWHWADHGQTQYLIISTSRTHQRYDWAVQIIFSCPDDHSLSIPWMLLFRALLPHRTSWSSDRLGWSVVEICASVLRFSALRLVVWSSVAGRGDWLNRLFWAFFMSTLSFKWCFYADANTSAQIARGLFSINT